MSNKYIPKKNENDGIIPLDINDLASIYSSDEGLRTSLLELINNISVAKRMLINGKYGFTNLPFDLWSRDNCRAYILGMEWALNHIIDFQSKKQKS